MFQGAELVSFLERCTGFIVYSRIYNNTISYG